MVPSPWHLSVVMRRANIFRRQLSNPWIQPLGRSLPRIPYLMRWIGVQWREAMFSPSFRFVMVLSRRSSPRHWTMRSSINVGVPNRLTHFLMFVRPWLICRTTVCLSRHFSHVLIVLLQNNYLSVSHRCHLQAHMSVQPSRFWHEVAICSPGTVVILFISALLVSAAVALFVHAFFFWI
jgi:hypothetical protein